MLLRVVDGPWPFPPNHQLAPQPLAALDLLEYPDRAAQRIARELLRALVDAKPAVLARRTARARVLGSLRMGKLLADGASQERQVGDADFDARQAQTEIRVKNPRPQPPIRKSGLDLLEMLTSSGKLSIVY